MCVCVCVCACVCTCVCMCVCVCEREGEGGGEMGEREGNSEVVFTYVGGLDRHTQLHMENGQAHEQAYRPPSSLKCPL